MKLLHICTDYSRQKLYKKLFSSLSFFVDQYVFTPVRSAQDIGAYNENQKFKVSYKHILSFWDKVFFINKIKKISRTLQNEIRVNDFNLIHAHFFYSDGAVALEMHLKHKIPYIVSFRNTDLNSFMRYRPDLIGKATQIAINSKNIIFLNESYLKAFLNRMPKKYKQLIKNKCMIVPNGIDEDWFNNSLPSNYKNIIRVLYVGDFTKNKNTIATMNAVLNISKFRGIKMDIIGRGGSNQKEVFKICSKNSNIFTYHPFIKEENELRNFYRQNDIFCMPSFNETFGMTYIEAMSQGCQIICSEDQGIDGYLNQHDYVYQSVNPCDVSSIQSAILSLHDHRFKNKEKIREISKNFSLKEVSMIYKKIYEG